MKYMLMKFGDGASMMAERTPEWVTEMIAFMGTFNAELEKTGELVEARGLDFPSAAKTVSLVGGQVVVSDGPFRSESARRAREENYAALELDEPGAAALTSSEH